MRDGRVFDVENLMNQVRNIKTADKQDSSHRDSKDESSPRPAEEAETEEDLHVFCPPVEFEEGYI